MDIYVLNTDLERIGIIDNYISLIWTKRYYKPGDFEMYLPASVEMLEILKHNYYLMREDDDRIMIIERVEIKTDAENGDHIIISGRSAESLLSRRIVWEQTNLSGTVESCIRQIIDENCITTTASDARRKIPLLSLGTETGFTETMTQQLRGDNVAEWLETVCMKYGWGWKIVIENNNFVFYLYAGADRTYGNAAGNTFVVFSPDYDNLINSNYAHDTTNFKNAALVLGEGEGAARRGVAAELIGGSYLNRYEMYVDARDVSSNDGEIPIHEYYELLLERGTQALSENTITELFDGEVDPGSYKCKSDYDIGDIIQIKNEYSIEGTTRIIEIIETDDDTGYKIVPTLQEWEV
jgi:hypothetical protein